MKALTLLLLSVLLAVLGSFLKTLVSLTGLPNLLPALRDPLIIGLAIYGVSLLPVFDQVRWRVLLAALMAFVLAYAVTSMLQDKALVGFYFLRLYVMPVLFALAALALFAGKASPPPRLVMIGVLLWWNALLFLFSVALYVLLAEMPLLRPALFGSEVLSHAWYISGGTWVRMGLPATGPNSLGLIFALNALLFFALWLQGQGTPAQPRVRSGLLIAHSALASLGMVLTFSRSSMLGLSVGALTLLLLTARLDFTSVIKVIGLALGGLFIAIAGALGLEIYSGGDVSRWLGLNLALRDPSMLGHGRSVQEALSNWADYIVGGYPRGTVGPKALLFASNINSVESSMLAVLLDMGLPMAFLYAVLIGTLLYAGFQHRTQLAVLAAVAIPAALLPIVFEIDLLIYCFFAYLLLGYFAECTARQPRSRAAWTITTPWRV